jgi:anti-sigma regulatory factor (Ser/Thr protein kinase)
MIMSMPVEQNSAPAADDYVAERRQDSGGIGPLDLVAPALPESLRDVRVAMRRWLSEIGAAPRAVADLLVAVGEACANAVEHAYGPGGGTVTVRLELQMPDVLATVCDTGHWRAPRIANRENRGRGTQFMHNCSNDLRIDHGPTGTKVVVRRRLDE